mmetsp:Transcript_14757/g.36121  ORF Transcript_14757/g.36121 Transcript_14757/m.36121 type:complete len:250 (-) Transcript_14757:1140-1889(-)
MAMRRTFRHLSLRSTADRAHSETPTPSVLSDLMSAHWPRPYCATPATSASTSESAHGRCTFCWPPPRLGSMRRLAAAAEAAASGGVTASSCCPLSNELSQPHPLANELPPLYLGTNELPPLDLWTNELPQPHSLANELPPLDLCTNEQPPAWSCSFWTRQSLPLSTYVSGKKLAGTSEGGGAQGVKNSSCVSLEGTRQPTDSYPASSNALRFFGGWFMGAREDLGFFTFASSSDTVDWLCSAELATADQ